MKPLPGLLLAGALLLPAFLAGANSSAPSSPVPAPDLSPFDGIQQGHIFRSGSGNTDPVTIFIDPKKHTATVSQFAPGPQTGRVHIEGVTLTWKWMLATWTLTLHADGRTASLDADSIFEACRGTVVRRSDH